MPLGRREEEEEECKCKIPLALAMAPLYHSSTTTVQQLHAVQASSATKERKEGGKFAPAKVRQEEVLQICNNASRVNEAGGMLKDTPERSERVLPLFPFENLYRARSQEMTANQ